MSKQKRNALCSCGSGKKFKNCCGASNLVDLNPRLVNKELKRLHNELTAFAQSEYKEQLEAAATDYLSSFQNISEDTRATYATGLTYWLILNTPFSDQTIMEDFQKRQQNNIKHEKTKSIFQTWADASPAVFEVQALNLKAKQTAAIRNVLTDQVYEIPYLNTYHFKEGHLLIGTLIPYMSYYSFFYTLLQIPDNTSSVVQDLAFSYDEKKGGLNGHFPYFLAHVLTGNKQGKSETDGVLKNVSQQFREHMQNKEMDEDIITSGIMLWDVFCRKTNPSIKKPSSYAASLEYLIQLLFIEDPNITQSQLAEEYNVTSGTISANFRKLKDVLFDEIIDFLMRSQQQAATSDNEDVDDFEELLKENNLNSKEEIHAYLDDLLSR